MKKSFTKYSILLVIFTSLSLSGCRLDAEADKLEATVTSESSIRLCSDGIDNDGNGLIDCEDPGCLVRGTESMPGPGDIVCPHIVNADGSISLLENNEYTCSDGKDNDGNGFVDCRDRGCHQTKACCISSEPENTLEACSDGIDNDCNGYIDCADHGCSRRGTPEAIAYCQKINCPHYEAEDTLEKCTDGIDNDCNGHTDCEDFSCTRHENLEIREAVLEYCENLKDSKKAFPEDSEEACSDGIDNDLNGLIDCDDPKCHQFNYCKEVVEKGIVEPPPRPADFNELSPTQRAAILQLELTMCTDGIDNDRNGKMDCEEYACQVLSLRKLKDDEAQYQIDCGL